MPSRVCLAPRGTVVPWDFRTLHRGRKLCLKDYNRAMSELYFSIWREGISTYINFHESNHIKNKVDCHNLNYIEIDANGKFSCFLRSLVWNFVPTPTMLEVITLVCEAYPSRCSRKHYFSGCKTAYRKHQAQPRWEKQKSKIEHFVYS